jgi:hypothetical protein
VGEGARRMGYSSEANKRGVGNKRPGVANYQIFVNGGGGAILSYITKSK